NSLRRIATKRIKGALAANDALAKMLEGTGLVFDFVNDRTVAVTPVTESAVGTRRRSQPSGDCGGPWSPALEQVLVTALPGHSAISTLPGSPLIELTQHDIEQSGFTTVQDLLRTLPQVVGRGPSDHTVLGLEAGTNSSGGTGINWRGLG